jgi:hypothetical protein
MIVLRPGEVKFGSDDWDNVARVSVDRLSSQTIDEWDDLGPNLVFVDVVRRRAVIRVSQEIVGDDLSSPIPGDLGVFSFVGSAGSDVGERKVEANAVVESVLSKVSDFGSTRVITLIAVSSDGSVDPITVSS